MHAHWIVDDTPGTQYSTNHHANHCVASYAFGRQRCALGLLANLKKTREVKGTCRVEATSKTTLFKE